MALASRVTRVVAVLSDTTRMMTRQIIKRELARRPPPQIKSDQSARTPPLTRLRKSPQAGVATAHVAVAAEEQEAAGSLEAAVAGAEAPPGGTTMTSMCSQASAPEIS